MIRLPAALAPLVLAAAAALALASPALARDATAAEVRDLAGRAAADPGALDELRRIDSVDGRPVDLARALADTEGAELRRRLAVLTARPPTPAPDAAAARAQARDVLAERRFREVAPPRPFRGVLEWLGERLRPLDRAVGWLDARVPGGGNVLWAILAGLVVALAALAAARVARRRAGRALAAAANGGRPAGHDPRRLEREAGEAERRGELERALRLRFRAGLLRLDRARTVPFRASLTTGEVARRLSSPEFDRVAATFDEVVYGGRPPTAEDVRTAREGWARVLEKAGAR